MIFLFLIVGSDFIGKNHRKVNLFLRGYVMSINTENKIALIGPVPILTLIDMGTYTYGLESLSKWLNKACKKTLNAH